MSQARIEQLQRKLRAREGVSGFEKNCEELRREIARLTTVPSSADAPAVASDSEKDLSGE